MSRQIRRRDSKTCGLEKHGFGSHGIRLSDGLLDELDAEQALRLPFEGLARVSS
jgi:hypothetical protein